jgi:hypothetical protein
MHIMKASEGGKLRFHVILNCTLEVDGQLHAPAALFQIKRKTPVTTGSAPVGVNIFWKRGKDSCRCGESNHGSSDVQTTI